MSHIFARTCFTLSVDNLKKLFPIIAKLLIKLACSESASNMVADSDLQIKR